MSEQRRVVDKVEELLPLCDHLEAAQKERESRRNALRAESLHRLRASDEGEGARQADVRFFLDRSPRLITKPEHVESLRQAVLDLAVRGRLVPQDPNEEPAAALLHHVDAWRASAIAAKRMRAPRKPLGSTEDWDAQKPLPRGWVWVRLGRIIHVHSGEGLTTDQMSGGTVPVFGGNGISGFHSTPNVHSPTVVIGRVGYHCGSIHLTPAHAWVTDNAFITDFSNEAISQSFLVLLLRATDLKENERATAQPVISGAKIYPIVVGLPPLGEQHRIVAKVEELVSVCDDLGAALRSAQTESVRLLEALLHGTIAGVGVATPLGGLAGSGQVTTRRQGSCVDIMADNGS